MSDSNRTMAEMMEALEASGFRALEIQSEGRNLRLRLPTRLPPPPPAAAEAPAAPATPGLPREDATLLCSPRVGHYYPRAGLGGATKFKAGDPIEKGEVYGSIEAMHLKYELRAEHSGVVAEHLAVEGEAVEYGQPLLRLRGADA